MKKLFLGIILSSIFLTGCGKTLIEKKYDEEMVIENFGEISITNLSHYTLTSYSSKMQQYTIVSYDIDISYLEGVENLTSEEVYFENSEEVVTNLDSIQKNFGYKMNYFDSYNSKLQFNEYFDIASGTGTVYHIAGDANELFEFYANNKLVIETKKEIIKVHINIENAMTYTDEDFTYSFPHTLVAEGGFELELFYSDEFIDNGYSILEMFPEYQYYEHFFKGVYTNISGNYIDNFMEATPKFDINILLTDGNILSVGTEYYDINPGIHVSVDGSTTFLCMLQTGGIPKEHIAGFDIIIKGNGPKDLHHIFLLEN